MGQQNLCEAAEGSKCKAAWEAATIARLTTEAQTKAAAKYEADWQIATIARLETEMARAADG